MDELTKQASETLRAALEAKSPGERRVLMERALQLHRQAMAWRETPHLKRSPLHRTPLKERGGGSA